VRRVSAGQAANVGLPVIWLSATPVYKFQLMPHTGHLGLDRMLARRPYDLRHAAVSTWLNAGIPAPQVANWAGHSVDVLLRVYAKCISGQQTEAKRRIEEATRPRTIR